MKLKKYLIDKSLNILIYILGYLIILLMLLAFKTPTQLNIAITIIIFAIGLINILIDYFRKKSFYDLLILNTKRLDKKYLITETLPKPTFYEGNIMYNELYDINKSMIEHIKSYKNNINDFKEYIEMWIHEVKIPISSLTLMYHNHKEEIDKKYKEQVRILDNYIDQVLYYVRSENAEKDYLIRETRLDKIINKVALKNKDNLLEEKIDLEVDVENIEVLTDSKWLEFILNQIINNSIKYKNKKVSSYIKITAQSDKNKIILNIYDNGIGIPKSDLNKVFEKTFTGENGRGKSKSTGMGLYIAKKLCQKLGATIEINSQVLEYTCVKITFPKNNFYKLKD